MESMAQSGDETAKSLLSDYRPPAEPEKQPPATEENRTGAAETPAEPEKAAEEPQAVDKQPGKQVQVDRRPTKLDTIRELRGKVRDLKAVAAEVPALKEQLAALQAQMKSLHTGQKPTETTQDTLTKLLADPDKFLADYTARIIQETEEKLNRRFEEFPQRLNERQMRSEATKIIESAGFDLEGDPDPVYDLWNANGISDDQVDQLAKSDPMTFARLTKLFQEKKDYLPPRVTADKAAAASAAASGAKPAIGAKPTLEDLNVRARQASARGDNAEYERVVSQISALVSGE
jgi:hypothetical protein